MPERSFKVNISNQSGYLSLIKNGDNTCEGQYTAGWGTPPTRIPPGQTIAFQGESSEVLHGTEGWVQYNAVDGAGTVHGIVGIHWSSPWLGNASVGQLDGGTLPFFPKAHVDLNVQDSCGSEMNATDGFLQNEPFDFDLQLGPYEGTWSGVGNDGDGHAEVDLTLVDTEQEGFTNPGYTYSSSTSAKVTDWTGHWAGGGVDILITTVSGDTATIKITDSGSSPALAIAETTDLSKSTGSAASHAFMKSVLSRFLKSTPAQASANELTKSALLSLEKIPSDAAPDAARRMLNEGIVHAMEGSTAVSAATARQISFTLVKLFVQDRVYLEQGVVLTLMNKCDSNNVIIGHTIRYQRINALGHAYRDLEVPPYSAPPR